MVEIQGINIIITILSLLLLLLLLLLKFCTADDVTTPGVFSG